MRVLLLCFVVLLSACSGPLMVIPGGALDGAVTAPPSDWSAVAGPVDTVQVEFRPADPYSINIWGVGIGPAFYIATGDDGTRWTKFIDADPAVRVRVGETMHALQAARVTDAAERAQVIDAYVKKYELDPADNWVTTGMIFRLDRRP